MRAALFGPDGDTTWNLRRLQKESTRFEHHDLDIRDRASMLTLFRYGQARIDLALCRATDAHSNGQRGDATLAPGS